MKNKLILFSIFLFISVTSFAQKNYVGVDLVPFGESVYHGIMNYEVIYQRTLNEKSFFNVKLNNLTPNRTISTAQLVLDSCIRRSYYLDNNSITLRFGYFQSILKKSNFSISVGGELNTSYLKGLVYAEDEKPCPIISSNHIHALLGDPVRTKGLLIGIVPTVNFQYQFWKNFVFSAEFGIGLDYEINRRGYINLDGEVIRTNYTGFLNDFSRNHLIQDIAILYRF